MSADPLTRDTIIRRSDALLSTSLGDDVVMMDVEQGAYDGLEEVAARIWELTEQPATVATLCDQLVTEYRISQEQCQQEVLTFLAELVNRRIVQIQHRADS